MYRVTPKKLYIFQLTISLELLKKLNRFHQNVHKVSKNKE